MSEMSGESTPVDSGAVESSDVTESVDTSVDTGADSSLSINTDQPIKSNPAWQPILDVLPSSLHEIVSPTLKEWDKGVNERFREIHSQYEPYKEYQAILDAGIPMDDIATALSLMQQIQNDPKSVWDTMNDYYKFQEQIQQENPVEDEYLGYVDPNEQKLTELENTVKQLTDLITSEREQAQLAEQEQVLDSVLGDLKEKYGDYDEEFVLTQMAAGADPETAVQSYMSLVERIKTDSNRPQAPTVVGGGLGGVVAPLEIKDMSAQDRRGLVADMLRAAKDI